MTSNLMLYIHVPFCPSKCHFCGWVQGMPKSELLLGPDDQPRRDYVDALCREIRGRAAVVRDGGYVPNIIYWGGGTGTILIESEMEQIHGALADSYDLSKITEATIEGSPDTVSPRKLRAIRQLGYSRLSLGIQSFNDPRLRHLGRVHDAARARVSVEWAAAAGFSDINIDLMCGLPDETITEVEETVRAGIELPVTHISYYPYRPVQGTVTRMQLASGHGAIEAAHQKRAYRLGRDLIEGAGFRAYAMSYFGANSLNDLAIFRLQQDWLGFGSGAHSLLGGTSRIHHRGRLIDYIESPMKWDSSVPAHSAALAPMLLGQGLSTFKGIARGDWLERTGHSLEKTLLHPSLQRYLDHFRRYAGLIEDDDGIRLDPEKLIDVFIDQLLAIA